MRSPKLWVVVLLMLFTAVELHLRGDVDRVPPSRPLSEMLPRSATARLSISPSMRKPWRYWAREISSIGFICGHETCRSHAQATTLTSGCTSHTSRHNVPAVDSLAAKLPARRRMDISAAVRGYVDFTDSTGKEYRVGDYLITNGSATEEALYWYQLHGEDRQRLQGEVLYAGRLDTLRPHGRRAGKGDYTGRPRGGHTAGSQSSCNLRRAALSSVAGIYSELSQRARFATLPMAEALKE
jgi:hypothetical protein